MLLLATFFPATEEVDIETNDDIVTVSDSYMLWYFVQLEVD